MASAIVGLGVLFFLGHALNWFFVKTKIPDLLILVVLGFFLGPVLGVLTPEDFGKVGPIISAIALIVILYEGGLNLSAKDLLSGSLPAAGLSIIGFLLSVGIGIFVTYGLALQSFSTAVLVGVGIGSTSSAIVTPMVKYLSIDDKTKTILSLESAFTDVITIVIFLVLVDAFAAGQFNASDVLIGLGPNTVLALLVGFASAILWAVLKLYFNAWIPKAFAGEAWALLTYGVLELLGLSGAIGVLSLGFWLANTNLLPKFLTSRMKDKPVSVRDLFLLNEITFLLRTIFFLYLGLLINFTDWKVILLSLVICLLIVISRYFMVLLVMPAKKYKRLDAMVTTAMGPRGLACAVLATIPAQRGLEGGLWVQNIMFSVIPFSILFTAIFVALSEKPNFRQKMGKIFTRYSDSEDNPLL